MHAHKHEEPKPLAPAHQAALDAALEARRRGFYVVPGLTSGPTKKPSLKGWQAHATRDEAQIRHWWTGQFAGAAVCLFNGKFDDPETGETVMLLSIDTDMKDGKNGERELAEVCADPFAGGDLPPTYTQRTPSGGFHRVYKTRRQLRQAAPLKHGVVVTVEKPGIDTRAGAKGFVYAAGSVWNGRAYSVERDAPVAWAPAWLESLVGERSERASANGVWAVGPDGEEIERDSPHAIRRARRYLEQASPAIEGAGGDEHTVAVANAVLDLGVSPEQAIELMAEIWNPTCRDPWPLDGDGDQGQTLGDKVRSAATSRTKPIGWGSALADFDIVPPANDNVDTPKARRQRIHGVWPTEVHPVINRAWLVDKLIQPKAMSVVYGESNVGKTALVMSLAYRIATGRPFAGRRTHKGVVVYIAAEASTSAQNRLHALIEHHGDDRAAVPFLLVPCLVDLRNSAADVDALVDLIADMAKPRGGAVLIVVDTLSRAFAGGNENSPDDMGAFVTNVDRLRVRTAAHVLVIHHSGKDLAKGARGHSLLRAATDTEIEIQAGMAKITKQRDGESGASFAFSIQGVAIGTDDDGETVTAALATPDDAAQDFADMKVPPVGEAANILDIVRGAGGSMTVDKARLKFCDARRKRVKDRTHGAHTTAFRRALEALEEDGHVTNTGGVLATKQATNAGG
jgi:hypothetical protein